LPGTSKAHLVLVDALGERIQMGFEIFGGHGSVTGWDVLER
jgi:hypothetical protein